MKSTSVKLLLSFTVILFPVLPKLSSYALGVNCPSFADGKLCRFTQDASTEDRTTKTAGGNGGCGCGGTLIEWVEISECKDPRYILDAFSTPGPCSESPVDAGLEYSVQADSPSVSQITVCLGYLAAAGISAICLAAVVVIIVESGGAGGIILKGAAGVRGAAALAAINNAIDPCCWTTCSAIGNGVAVTDIGGNIVKKCTC